MSFCCFIQLKEITFGVLITFLLVSCRNFSIHFVSLANQLSSLPHFLPALVFILLEDGGVDSMFSERRIVWANYKNIIEQKKNSRLLLVKKNNS